MFVHDNGQIVLDFADDELGELSAEDLQHRYFWSTRVDELLADETVDDATVEDVAWALLDHQNSVRQLAVFDGEDTEVVKAVDYDAFGNATVDPYEPGPEILFLYTARPFDPDTGLQNNLNRWYDATIGRWLGEDPIGFTAGDANLYRYCGNAPLTHIDASGLEKAWVSFAESTPAYVAGSGAMARSPFGPEPPQWMLEQAIDDSNSASSPGYLYYLVPGPGHSAPADPWILNWGSEIAGGIGIGALVIAGGVVILAPGAAGAGAGAGTTVEIAAVTYPSALVTTEIVAAPLAPALVTTEIVAAAPMTLGSTIAVGSTITATVTATDMAVIGYFDYTLAFDGVTGFNVLNVPNWTWAGSNVPWLENIVALGESVIVYPGASYTRAEIAWLIEAGYVHIENVMVPGIVP